MVKILVWCMVSLCLVSASHGQSRTSYSGKIIDSGTSEPIEGGKVLISSSDKIAITDAEGIFVFQQVETGKQIISVWRDGYQQQTFEVMVDGSSRTLRTFELSLLSILNEEEVIITASRKEEKPLNTPQAISFLSDRQILENNPRSMAEALIGVPGVWMQKTNHGGGSPFLRGLTGNQTLVLIDGIRLNNSTFRYGPNQYLNTIDPLSVQRVEVVRGSGSVQFGSDALGGAINILSNDPEFIEEGLRVSGRTLFKTGNAFWEDEVWSQELTGRAEVQIQTPRIATRAGVSYKNFGELVAASGPQAPSAYQERTGDFKTRIKLGNNLITLAWQSVQQDSVGRYDQVTQLGRYELYQFDPQERTLAYVRYAHESANIWFRRIEATLSYQNSVEERDKRRVGASETNFEQDEVRTLGIGFQMDSRPVDNWSFVSGVEGYFDRVNSRILTVPDIGDSSISRGLYPDEATANNLAAYSIHSLEFRRFHLQAGIRYNLIQIQTEDPLFGDLAISPQAVVANAGFIYCLDESQRLILALNSGFRAPNINDLGSFGGFDLGVEVPNDDLASERTITIETGYKIRNQKLSASLSAYYTRLLNLIARERAIFQGDSIWQDQKVYTKVNVDEALITGVEGQFGWTPNPDLLIYGHATYTYGQTLDDSPSPCAGFLP